MRNPEITHKMTDKALPEDRGNRLFLFAVRRMAMAGVNDAHAANALLGTFGKSYRRPLVLLRAMMLEMARASSRKIMVAPCCCSKMTGDEALLMQAVSEGLSDPHAAYERVSELLASDAALGALTCVQAVAQSFADLGRPMEFYAAA
ncbi:MAG: DUF6628 family protein [Sphingobium phenoxybenzoativorans]|uniref:DUF6628 family protein n=1 Tax=Sphingobium phenoxybenzoativorans TaxID=1592790 RepID=UPI000872E13F|nr:DUF6628 family protein [Sphingobium phenoxybenzoativorans]